MKIHEYQAKDLFSDYGVPVEKQLLCRTAEDALAAYHQLGSSCMVVKAQVLTGGRGKAGGIKLVKDAEEAYRTAQEILSMTIKELPVTKLLLCRAVDIAAEYYLSFVVDRNTRAVLLIMSSAGGIDIEEVSRNNPEKIVRFNIDPSIGIPDYLARRFAFHFFSQPEQVAAMSRLIQSLYRLMLEKDASLVEVNPLAVTNEGKLIAVDAKMTFDDNALYRQPEIVPLFEPTADEEREVAAKEKGFSYIRMEGEIGCMVNGAGLAMATMDMIQLYGASPANFLDIGGSSNPTKVIDAMELLLQNDRVQVVLINIFGGITRCDDVATGLLEAFSRIETTIPVIVRLTGTNEERGRELLRTSDRFQVAETMSEATLWAVQSLKKETT